MNKEREERIIEFYAHDYQEDSTMVKIHQSKIVQSDGLLETSDQFPEDELTWTYNTEESVESLSDYLEEDDILYKL